MEQGWPGLAQYTCANPADWSPRPRTVQDALDQLASRGGGAGAASSFVWRPAGAAGPGVYTTWAALAAAIATLDPAVRKFVSVDNSLGNAHVTTGSWPDIENVEFLSGGPDATNDALATINIDEGALWPGAQHVSFNGVNVNDAAATTSLINTAANTDLVIDLRACIFEQTGVGPGIVTLGAGSEVSVRADELTVIGDGTHPIFAGSATSGVLAFCFCASVFNANAVNLAAGGAVVIEADGSCFVSATQTPAPSIVILDPTPTFVFQPGGTAGGNVYTAWASLMASVALTPGPKWIVIDTAFGAATVTAGTWNVEQCTFRGATGRTQTILGFATGAVLVWTELTLEQSVRFVNNGTGNVTTQAVAGWILYLHASNIQSAAAPAVPWLRASANGTIQTFDAGSVGDATHNVVTVDAGVTVISQNLGDGSTLAHAYGGLGAVSPQLDDAGGFSATQDISTVNATFLFSLATQLSYTPGTAGNWNPVPAVASAALDQLAASNHVSATGNTGTGGAAVTVTTGNITKAKNGLMQVSASCLLTTSAAASTLTLQLKRDAGNIGTAKTLVVPATGIPAGIDCTIDFIDTAPDNAAHTYTLSVSVSAGTLTVAANSAQIQVVEDS